MYKRSKKGKHKLMVLKWEMITDRERLKESQKNALYIPI